LKGFDNPFPWRSAAVWRKYDVQAGIIRFSELKYAGDPITPQQVQEDSWLVSRGYDITYDFVPGLVGGEEPQEMELLTLDYWGVPWKVWGPEFWTPNPA
jgi:hypothetical protein